MPERILIFPAGMPRALAFLAQAQANGVSVVGASSLGHDPARARYPCWVHLPFVGVDGFDDALRHAIATFGIDRIYTPNPVVWDYLQRCMATAFPGVTLVNASPVDSEMAAYRAARAFARSLLEQPLELAAVGAAHAALAEREIAALFHHAETIPGMCDHAKLHALYAVFRHAPRGDIVEIGSWWGKSALVLTRLAQHYGIGCVLCVDPWSNPHLLQHDERGLLDRVPVDADEALQVFEINLLPYANGNLNYLRLPSVDAAGEYRRSTRVATPAFGTTTYSGRIALLHIDGNHSHASAQADVAAWQALVVAGGWIVIDDYTWPYGDGPQRVGDAFMAAHIDRLACAFIMGGALFMQLALPLTV